MQITPLPLRIYWHFFNFIAPAACPVCHKPQFRCVRAFLCPTCRPSQAPKPRCQTCGRTLPDIPSLQNRYITDCRLCRTQKPLFKKAISVAPYHRTWREAILAFKCGQQGDLTWQMAHLLQRNARQYLPWDQIQAVIPIPARQRQEDHPAYRLSHCLAQLGQKCFMPCLKFLRNVAPQRGLKRRERLANMRHTLYCKPTKPFTTVLLVDDVFTTGATVREGTRALLAAGIKHVYVAVLAQGWNE